MKYCKKCGREIPDGKQSCEKCRNAILMAGEKRSYVFWRTRVSPRILLRTAEFLLLVFAALLLFGDCFYGVLAGECGAFSFFNALRLSRDVTVLGAVFLLLLGVGIVCSILSMILRSESSYAGFFSLIGAAAFYLLLMVRVMDLAGAEAQGKFVPSKILFGGYAVLLLLILAASLEVLAKNIDRMLENRKKFR